MKAHEEIRIEAAEAICNADGEPVSTLDGLASLVDRSLLRQEQGPDGEPRFTMLETIREYALALQGVTSTAIRAKAFLGAGGLAYGQSDYRDAIRFYQQSLSLYREQGDQRGVGGVLNNLGVVARAQGQHADAVLFHEESLALFRKIKDTRSIAYTLCNLGHASYRHGDDTRAAACFAESLHIFRDLGDRRGIAEILERLAELAVRKGLPTLAARFGGAAEALRDTIGIPSESDDIPLYERVVALARLSMGQSAFADAFAAGRALPQDQTIVEALTFGSSLLAGRESRGVDPGAIGYHAGASDT
jgi:tetratricopeptide (TPR) repeat protein